MTTTNQVENWVYRTGRDESSGKRFSGCTIEGAARMFAEKWFELNPSEHTVELTVCRDGTPWDLRVCRDVILTVKRLRGGA